MPTLSYQFIPAGGHPVLQPNHYYIGLGQSDWPRAFNHRLVEEKNDDRTPADLVWQRRGEIERSNPPNQPIVLVLEDEPNWSNTWAAVLLEWILLGEPINDSRVEALNTFARYQLSGFNPGTGAAERSLVAVFEGLRWQTRASLEEDSESNSASDLYPIEK